jgi:cysteinyl-tRNA synthetase
MSSIVFDTIRRYLLHLGYEVRYAQNFTDVEDKIINRANAEGLDPHALVESLIAEWHEEISAFNVLPATVNPRATQEIPQIIAMIEQLIARDHAYAVNGDVFFRVRSFPNYGALSGRNLDELDVGVRIGLNEAKSDPLDFALWKSAKPSEPHWPSPWGEGRPGWHIECSAMGTHHLNGVVDIHGGGRDLIFPHHENEIAQSEAASGHTPFANFWVHNGMLQLNGEKMSKSLGNVVSLRSLIDRGREQAFRVQVLQTHYRAPLNFTERGLEAAASGLERLRAAATPGLSQDPNTASEAGAELLEATSGADHRFHDAMNADFNTPIALASLFDLAKIINRLRQHAEGTEEFLKAQRTLVDLADVLGLDLSSDDRAPAPDGAPFVELLIDVRSELRAAKQWALSDMIRDGLLQRGVVLEDGPDGTTWKVHA